MKYIALLRGINVGGNRTVKMEKLRGLFERAGHTNVSTYINSGNVVFESQKSLSAIRKTLEKEMKVEFGFEIPTIIKTEAEMKKIARAIPRDWLNDEKQRTDVAYLFKEADSKTIIDELPFKKEYVNVRYVKGAVLWNINRKNVMKSRLNKVIGHKHYKFMTIRNVNTARFLAGMK